MYVVGARTGVFKRAHMPRPLPSPPSQISIVGDFEAPEVEELALKYLGSIPKSTRKEAIATRPLPPPVEDSSRRFMQGR